MGWNLRTKVILTVGIFLVVIFALTTYQTLTRSVHQLNSSLNQQSTSFASLATSPIGNAFLLYQDSGSIKITQKVNKYLALDPDVISVRIVSVDGEQVYDSRDEKKSPINPNLASSFQPQYLKTEAGYIHEIVQPFFEDSGAHRYSMVYDISTQRISQTVTDSIRQILYTGLAILVISIVVTSWALNVLFIRPLRAVSRSADIISAGDYNHQIVSKNRDEIGSLAQAVNKMAESLKADIEKLRGLDKLKSEFLMIASHNLRTPLTIMRGSLEMGDQAKTPEELKAIIASIQESVVRLHLLSEDLLTISTLESGDEPMTKTKVEARNFIDATVSEFALLAKKKQLVWQFDNRVPDDVSLAINQANMRSALGNIIDNAIKFTKARGSVTVKADITQGQLHFVVADTGIGITPEEQTQLFTKFHRGTSTLTYDYEGAGVGLYLTKLIVEAHGGRITVQSQADHGSTFTVRVPLELPGPGLSSPEPPAT